MKTIPLQTEGDFKTLELIRNVIERPANGAKVSTMRAGIRILDEIEKLPEDAKELKLEDSDFGTLVNSLNETTFTVVRKDLLETIDGILNAK